MKKIFKTITIMLASITLSNAIIGCASIPKAVYNPSLKEIFSTELPLIKEDGKQNLSVKSYYEPNIKAGFQIKNLELGESVSFSKEDLDLYNNVLSFTSAKKYGVRITDQYFLQLLTNEIMGTKKKSSFAEKITFERYKNNYVLFVFENYKNDDGSLIDFAGIIYNGNAIDIVYFVDDKSTAYSLAQYGIIVKE